jgi:hypothetical protein
MQKMNVFILLSTLCFICACDNGSDEGTNQTTEQIKNNSNTTQSKAIAIYNHAYQENFESDAIVDIIANAKNGYILVNPFEDDVTASIVAIKANGN